MTENQRLVFNDNKKYGLLKLPNLITQNYRKQNKQAIAFESIYKTTLSRKTRTLQSCQM